MTTAVLSGSGHHEQLRGVAGLIEVWVGAGDRICTHEN